MTYFLCLIFSTLLFCKTTFAEERKQEVVKNRKPAAEEILATGTTNDFGYKVFVVKVDGKSCVVSVVEGQKGAGTAIQCLP